MHSDFLEIATQFKEFKVRKKRLVADMAAGYEIFGEPPNQTFLFHKHDDVVAGEQVITLEVIKAVVFLAMYCEAYIWDLGASILGDQYAKKYLDKLDTFSKWVVIPRMLFGKGLDTGHHSMEKLRELIRWRNEFVHAKSKDATDLQRNLAKFQDDFKPLDEKIDLEGIFAGIDELFAQLRHLDPAGYHHFTWE